MKGKFRAFLGILLAAATLCGSLFLGGCGGDGENMNDTFYNPIHLSGQDPWFYKHGEYYYHILMKGVERNGKTETAFTITRSKSLTTLYPDMDDPETTHIAGFVADSNIQSVWAPEIFFFEDHWYLLFTAATTDEEFLAGQPDQTDRIDSARRTYIIKSETSDPFGNYGKAVKLGLSPDYRSIDATFMDYNGRQYVIWAGWPNEMHTAFWQQNLYITELETGDPTKVKADSGGERNLISEPKAAWERNSASQNEGPCLVYAPDGTPVLLFSASYSASDCYCIGYLKMTGDDPVKQSSWEKCDKPLMETDLLKTDVISPGHNSVVKSPDGTEDWIVYHAAKHSGAGWSRTVRLQKLIWEGNTPKVEMSAWTEELKLPSGDVTEKVRYEAENATLTDGCSVKKFEKGDYFSYASKDKAVSFGGDADTVTFKFQAKRAGKAVISYRYSNAQADKGAVTTIVRVNGEESTLQTPYTGYEELFTVSQQIVSLREGENTVTFSGRSNLLLDCIVVTYY